MDRVCLAYLERIAPQAQAVIQHRAVRRVLDTTASTVLFDLLSTPTNFRRRLIRAALRRALARKCDGKNRLYLNVGHTGLNDPGFRTWVRRASVRPVYLLHDLIPITHPEYCRPGESDKHRARIRTVLETAVAVIGNSEATLDDLRAFAKTEGRSCPPALAVLLGCDALPSLANAESAPGRPTFVILGTIEARKNHLMILQVWRALVRRLGTNAPRLLVIGQRGWECEQALDLLDRSELLRGSVTEISGCDDTAVARHLSQARALLFPSLVEGYGLPLVEALGAGVPVIASDLPVFREVAGDVPDYLDPLDARAWEKAILSYAQEPSVARTDQLKRMAAYRAPTWEDHFAAVNSWLSTI